MNGIKSLILLGICIILISNGPQAKAQNQKVNFLTAIRDLSNVEALPRYQDNTVIRQTSSYDTTGNNDDGFSGKYSFVRRNADSSLVIFEAKGNGVINRIWTPTPTDELLDFYFGGKSKPDFSIRFSDLFSGRVFPFIAPFSGNQVGGYFSYLPIPFHKGCKIVYRGKKMQFYQIQYRSYPKNVQVENFKLALNNAEKAAVNALQHQWTALPAGFQKRIRVPAANQRLIRIDTSLKAGETLVLADVSSGGRIQGLQIGPAENFAGLNKNIDLRISWDDEAQPAIYMPLADFFGYAFGHPSMQSLLLGSAGDVNYCYFPMPFDRKAKIELLYKADPTTTSKPIAIQANIWLSREARNPQAEGKFYAWRNANLHAALGKPHVFLQGKGRGHYVGTILQAQGREPGMTLFFEGDDRTDVDGEMTIHGTGSEDYFNGGWYALLDRWDRKMSLPLHGALDYSLPFSRTGGYRLFLSDKLSFQKSFLHTIEHGPENNNKPVDYTSVALYYADAALTANAEPTALDRQVYLPDTLMLYPQLMNFSFGGKGTVDGNTLSALNGGQIRINLSEIPNGSYKMYADLERGPQGTEISLWQRQSPIGKAISFYKSAKELVSAEYLSDLDIDAFRNSITLQFKSEGDKNKIWINRLIFVRK